MHQGLGCREPIEDQHKDDAAHVELLWSRPFRVTAAIDDLAQTQLRAEREQERDCA